MLVTSEPEGVHVQGEHQVFGEAQAAAPVHELEPQGEAGQQQKHGADHKHADEPELLALLSSCFTSRCDFFPV